MAGAEEPQDDRPLQTVRGVLPVVGVGGAVCVFAGVLSIGSVALLAASTAAGVGAGRYLWSRAFDRRKASSTSSAAGASFKEADLPLDLQVGLMQWQLFLQAKCAGQQISDEELQRLKEEFQAAEPEHSKNVEVVQGLVAAGQLEDIPIPQRAGILLVGHQAQPVPDKQQQLTPEGSAQCAEA
mmetsp:Transcript_17742/g.41286  ORF Transcript_17742/g.41286 Transcript_17742/m.41286 type:complete len:183 (+) Transcript_17742:87-635(+)